MSFFLCLVEPFLLFVSFLSRLSFWLFYFGLLFHILSRLVFSFFLLSVVMSCVSSLVKSFIFFVVSCLLSFCVLLSCLCLFCLILSNFFVHHRCSHVLVFHRTSCIAFFFCVVFCLLSSLVFFSYQLFHLLFLSCLIFGLLSVVSCLQHTRKHTNSWLWKWVKNIFCLFYQMVATVTTKMIVYVDVVCLHSCKVVFSCIIKA